MEPTLAMLVQRKEHWTRSQVAQVESVLVGTPTTSLCLHFLLAAPFRQLSSA